MKDSTEKGIQMTTTGAAMDIEGDYVPSMTKHCIDLVI